LGLGKPTKRRIIKSLGGTKKASCLGGLPREINLRRLLRHDKDLRALAYGFNTEAGHVDGGERTVFVFIVIEHDGKRIYYYRIIVKRAGRAIRLFSHKKTSLFKTCSGLEVRELSVETEVISLVYLTVRVPYRR
jgi:hypothetical protein